MKFSPYGSLIPSSCLRGTVTGEFYPEILAGSSSMNGAIKEGRGGENKSFSSLKRQCLKTVGYDQSYY